MGHAPFCPPPITTLRIPIHGDWEFAFLCPFLSHLATQPFPITPVPAIFVSPDFTPTCRGRLSAFCCSHGYSTNRMSSRLFLSMRPTFCFRVFLSSRSGSALPSFNGQFLFLSLPPPLRPGQIILSVRNSLTNLFWWSPSSQPLSSTSVSLSFPALFPPRFEFLVMGPIFLADRFPAQFFKHWESSRFQRSPQLLKHPPLPPRFVTRFQFQWLTVLVFFLWRSKNAAPLFP